MKKYKYKNLKSHVYLHGIPPDGEKWFDHPIAGGGIELIEQKDDKDLKSDEKSKEEKTKPNMVTKRKLTKEEI